MRFAVVIVVVIGLGLAAARPCAEITRRKKCEAQSHLCAWDEEKQTCGDAAETSGLGDAPRKNSSISSTSSTLTRASGRAMTNTSWWKLALSAPAVVPDLALVARHVCDMPAWADDVALVDERARTNRDIDLLRGNWRYFPAGCRSRGGPAWDGHGEDPNKAMDGLGHFGLVIADTIAKRRGARTRPHFFGESASTDAWLKPFNHLKKKFDKDYGKARKALRRYFYDAYPSGDDFLRGHFECFLAPPLDEWFGFDALPPEDDPAWERRAVAETYAALGREAFAGGETAPTASRASTCGTRSASSRRCERGSRPRRRALVLSDFAAETVAATLDGLDVGIRVGRKRRDGASRLVDGRTAGLEHDFDVSFHGAGNPLVTLHCMATADLLLGPEKCGDPWVPSASHEKVNNFRVSSLGGERCSHLLSFGRELSARGLFRGLPREPLDAAAVEAGLETVVRKLQRRGVIVRYLGKVCEFEGTPLYPTDPIAAYEADALIDLADDMRSPVASTFGIADQAEKEAARAALWAEGGKQAKWAAALDATLAKDPMATLTIGNLYAFCMVNMFRTPTFLDGVPPGVFDQYANIAKHHDWIANLAPATIRGQGGARRFAPRRRARGQEGEDRRLRPDVRRGVARRPAGSPHLDHIPEKNE
ncbi:hypothetical protein JL720_15157 [Aureococcus anophagefferens]|nr:hypothetical protein JL720_15157 [Aureococcus anophagefferens]